MPQRIRKILIFLLVALSLIANCAADFAHRHDWHDGRYDDPAFSQSQARQPVFERGQKLCIACLFASAHHSLQNDVSFVASLPPLIPIAPSTLHCVSQFNAIPCSNRAPPAGQQNF
ncbi:hypothetical protein L0337_40245 [candidate division KSB1 bacterium]|nr:hypothetical protein [candidate division KSB1 bacterium]